MSNILKKSLSNNANFTRILNIIGNIEDPRRTSLHPFSSLIMIMICAHLNGKYGAIAIVEYANNHTDWLESMIDLPYGIPSHDTFTRLTNNIHPNEMEKLFAIANQTNLTVNQSENITVEAALNAHISIDGKVIKAFSSKSPAVLVRAHNPNKKRVLGQVRVGSKTNEITAIPKLLDKLQHKLPGAIITIDAIGTQRKIVNQIVRLGAHYVLAVKGNQHQLHEDVKLYLDDLAGGKMPEVKHTSFVTLDKEHGRIEKRTCWTTTNIQWLPNKYRWKNLQSISVVETEITKDDQTIKSRRYYISDLNVSAEVMLAIIRDHWGIENSLHWPLNNTFKEHTSTIRKGRGTENASILRCIALSLIQQNANSSSIATKTARAGCRFEYLLELLTGEKVIISKTKPPSKCFVRFFHIFADLFVRTTYAIYSI